MKCEEFRPEIPFLASGETDGPEFQAHLAECPACRELLAEARRMDGLLRETFKALAPAAGLEERLSIPDLPPPATLAPRTRVSIPWLAAAAALAAAAVLVTVSLVQTRGTIERLEGKIAALERSLAAERQMAADQDKLLRALVARAASLEASHEAEEAASEPAAPAAAKREPAAKAAKARKAPAAAAEASQAKE